MTTKLSQRKVKSTDPAYPSLKEQMEARLRAEGTGYVMPVGGIPRGDMTVDVQNALSLAEISYSKPADGIPREDLSAFVQDSLNKADTAYQKPAGGIPIGDLEPSIQQRILDFTSYYVKPDIGIPYVDLDPNVQIILSKAVSAYQKPSDGIPIADLSQEIQDLLDKANTAYQKPENGIPLSDLAVSVATRAELNQLSQNLTDHLLNETIHQIDHRKLLYVGTYSHDEIDALLDIHTESISRMYREIEKARGGFEDLDRRITNVLYRNEEILLDGDDFAAGTKTNLEVSEEGFLRFPYVSNSFTLKFYNQPTGLVDSWTEANYLGSTDYDDLDLIWGDNIFQLSNGVKRNTNVGVWVEGFLYAPYTGTYLFHIQASGDYALEVGGQSVVTVYQNPAYIYDDEEATYWFSVDLRGGQFYPFRIRGRNRDATNCFLRVFWKFPNADTYQSIESKYFSNTGYNTDTFGEYISPVYDTETLDIIRWWVDCEVDTWGFGQLVDIAVRTSSDGQTFSDWQTITLNEEISEKPERYMQVRVQMRRNEQNRCPVVNQVAIRYFTKNHNVIQEVEQARGGFPYLKDRMDYFDDRIAQAVDLASGYDAINKDPSWLANARFEHVDLNFLRMTRGMMKNGNPPTSGQYNLFNGFVNDFNTDDFVDTTLSDQYQISNSMLLPVRNSVLYDTTADWNAWSRQNCAPNASGTLIITNVANAQMSGPAVYAVADTNSYSQNNQDNDTRTFYQPFYVNPTDHSFMSLELNLPGRRRNYYWYQSGFGWRQQWYNTNQVVDVWLVPSDPITGLPDLVREVYLGAFNSGGGYGTMMEIMVDPLPISATNCYQLPGTQKMKWYIGMKARYGYGYQRYSDWYEYYYSYTHLFNSTANAVATALNSDPAKDRCYVLDENLNVITGKYMPIKVNMYKAYHTMASATQVFDAGKRTNFLAVEYNIDRKDGVIEFLYQTSEDGVDFSPQVKNISQTPPGRYLKTTILMGRTLTNQTPEVRSLKIYYQPDTIVYVSKPYELTRIPTHVVFDVIDSGHFEYWVSRDGGTTFTKVVPGMQNDLRGVPSGTSLVIKITASRGVENQGAWIEYIGVQAITIDHYNSSNIVSMHQEIVASAGQTVFNLNKSYFIGDYSLQVFRDGRLLSVGVDYDETSNTSITLRSPATEGERFVFRVAAASYPLPPGYEPMPDAMLLQDQINQLDTRITGHDAEIAQIKQDAINNNDALSNRMTDAEADIALLQTGLENVNDNISTLIQRADATDNTLVDYDARLDQLENTVADIDPSLIGTKPVDESTIADGRMLIYSQIGDKLVYVDPPNVMDTDNLQQRTVLGVTGASAGNPRIENITIPYTTDFKRPPVEVLKLTGGSTNTVQTVNDFVAGDSSQYPANPNLVFDGSLYLKTQYSNLSTFQKNIGAGKLYKSPRYDKTSVKKFVSFEVTF